MNTFWETILSNALLVCGLAVGLGVLGRLWKNPASLHVLWILVLVKLFTPPLVTVEVPLPIHTVGENMPPETAGGEMPWSVVETSLERSVAVASSIRETPIFERDVKEGALQAAGGWRAPAWPVLLAWVWGLGIGVIALVQAYRVFRFRRTLEGCQNPTVEMQDMAASIAERLGLKRVPKILMTPIRLSPMVWRLGGRVRVILPIELFERLDSDAQKAILAHEFAHVWRKDHLVRLLELLATTLFWWHPVVWWAARSLRELEEQCCDAIVLDVMDNAARGYATALVDTLDFLSKKSVVAPMGVTAVKPVVSLTRRIEMLNNHRPAPRLTLGRLLLLVLAAAVPLGLTLAAEPPRPVKPPRAKLPVLSGPVAEAAVIAPPLKHASPQDRRAGSRQYKVFRLSNSPASDVANAINEFLRSERQVMKADQPRPEDTVVVPDVISNSLLIAASPSMTAEIEKLIEQLDQRPPTVRIEVLLAEVSVGAEDRVSDRPKPEESAPSKLAQLRALSGTEATIEDLIETLKQLGEVTVLSRPQIMTLDNQAAFIQIGERVPRVTSMTVNGEQTNRVELENIGLILGVTPRITPEGLVVMEIDAEKSELGPVEDGIPIGVSSKGEVIRSPRIKTLTAQTTISVADGKLVVLAGLATEVGSEKTQLLIALLPHIVKDDGE